VEVTEGGGSIEEGVRGEEEDKDKEKKEEEGRKRRGRKEENRKEEKREGGKKRERGRGSSDFHQ